jgi:uncharacterized protein YebE (UPF0316 family)
MVHIYVMNFIYMVIFRITLILQIKNYLYVSFSKLVHFINSNFSSYKIFM